MATHAAARESKNLVACLKVCNPDACLHYLASELRAQNGLTGAGET
jgi:hypothetical protein